jgi:hypothetical protein
MEQRLDDIIGFQEDIKCVVSQILDQEFASWDKAKYHKMMSSAELLLGMPSLTTLKRFLKHLDEQKIITRNNNTFKPLREWVELGVMMDDKMKTSIDWQT